MTLGDHFSYLYASLCLPFRAFEQKSEPQQRRGSVPESGWCCPWWDGWSWWKGSEYHLCRLGGVCCLAVGQAYTLQDESLFVVVVSSVQRIGIALGRICQSGRVDSSASLSYVRHSISHAFRDICIPEYTALGRGALRPGATQVKCPGQGHWTSHSQTEHLKAQALRPSTALSSTLFLP